MGQPSKPTCSSLTVPGSRVQRSSTHAKQLYPATHTSFPNSPYAVPPTSPPPLSYVGSPYQCLPLPPVVEPLINSVDVTVGVHPYLMFLRVPPIMWNVTLPCASITTADRRSLTPQALSEPATNPPRLALTIIISSELLWSIPVSASSCAYVTLWDVFNALHGALQLPVTPNEFNLLPSHEAKRKTIAEQASRVRDGGSLGVRRVDYLMGENGFMGLSSTARTGVWALNVS